MQKMTDNNSSDTDTNSNQKIEFYDKLPLIYSDPISALYLGKEFVMYGTTLGFSSAYHLETKKIKDLIKIAAEPISAVLYCKKIESYIIAIGDEEITHMVSEFRKAKVENEETSLETKDTHPIYNSERDHIINCESSFVLQNKNKILVILLNVENLSDYEINKCGYYIFDIDNDFKKEVGSFDLSNYAVPFDFYGDDILFIQQYEEGEREICIYNITNKEFNQFRLEKNFGSVNFMKILPNKNILIVKDYYNIEVYNKEFEKECETDKSKGEIEAIDIYEDDKNKTYIIVLDLEGNYTEYLYEEENITETLSFNLYSFKEFSNKIKDIGFFDLQFPYYVKANERFITMAVDGFCLIFKKP